MLIANDYSRGKLRTVQGNRGYTPAYGSEFQSLRHRQHLLGRFLPVQIYMNGHSHLPGLLLMLFTFTAMTGAIVFGHMARAQVRRSGYIRGGYAAGSIGMFLGYLYVVLFSYFFVMLEMHPYSTP